MAQGQFIVGSICIWPKAKNCPVPVTSVVLALIFHLTLLLGAMKKVLLQGWNPGCQFKLKELRHVEGKRMLLFRLLCVPYKVATQLRPTLPRLKYSQGE